jgi:hypothetical protein
MKTMLEHAVRVVAAGIAIVNTTAVLSVMSGDLERWMNPPPLQQNMDKFPDSGINQRFG